MAIETFNVFFPLCCTESVKADQNSKIMRLTFSCVFQLFKDLSQKQEEHGGIKYVSEANEFEQKLVLCGVKFGFVD